MPLFLEHGVNNYGKLALWHITESKEELLGLLPDTVSEESLRHTIPNERLFKQRIASRILLCHLLGETNIALGVAGAKRTVLLEPARQMSISHSGDYAAVMVGHDQKCGIDIELVQPRIGQIAQRFMNDEEWHYLGHREDFRGLMLLWAIKEAVFKYGQLEDVEFKTEIVCSHFAIGEAGEVLVLFSPTGVYEHLRVSYRFMNDYAMAWVSGKV